MNPIKTSQYDKENVIVIKLNQVKRNSVFRVDSKVFRKSSINK